MPASRLLIKGQPKESFTSYVLKLSHALEKYYRLKDAGSCKQFYAAANRNIGYVIEHLGDRPLDSCSTADPTPFRNCLIARQLTSTSIQRIFSAIRTAIKLIIYEDGLTVSNAFA